MGRQFRDISGTRFGRIVAIKPTEVREKQMFWHCQCDCGVEKEIGVNTLVSGNTNSCGCYRKERARALAPVANAAAVKVIKQPYGISSMHSLYTKYRISASKRNQPFEITVDQFHELTSGDCFYCGVQPYQIVKYEAQHGEYTYNGIDRIDSSIGYVMSNCVPCCGRCNMAKSDMSQQEFFAWVRRVYEFNRLAEL